MSHPRSIYLLAGLCSFAACQPNSETDRNGGGPIAELTKDLVGEWSSARRGDTEGETIIFARDRSVILRDGNYILRTSAPVPTGGRLDYEIDEETEPANLDFVVRNSVGEQVARIPGVVKVLTDDQVQVCMDPETLTRPVDFNGESCTILTKLSGQTQPIQERVVERPVYVDNPSSMSPPTATVNSPGDGFLALRSEPSIRSGSRVTRIPHNATVEVYECAPTITSVGSSRGQWCEINYNGQSGYAFDAFLVRR